MTGRKRVWVLLDAIEAAEVWPNGEITLHLSNGMKIGSVEDQTAAPEIMSHIYDNLAILRGEEQGNG